MRKKFQNQERLPELKVPNDKLTQTIADFAPDNFARAITDKLVCTITEVIVRGKPIKTSYLLEHVENYSDLTPIRAKDILVFSVCAAAYERGWINITVNQIARVLAGDKEFSHMSDALKEAILDSVKRLMCTRITVDMTDTCEVLKKYQMKKATLTDVLLPCKIYDNVKVNGQTATVIVLRDESPLMQIAEAKNQILRINTALLQIPEINDTPQNLTLKDYLVCRVLSIVKHKNLNDNITFSDLFAKCAISVADKFAACRIRKTIEVILSHLKAKGIISDFYFTMRNSFGKVVKYVSGNAYHGIKIFR